MPQSVPFVGCSDSRLIERSVTVACIVGSLHPVSKPVVNGIRAVLGIKYQNI
jgi:hypothetical protein